MKAESALRHSKAWPHERCSSRGVHTPQPIPASPLTALQPSLGPAPGSVDLTGFQPGAHQPGLSLSTAQIFATGNYLEQAGGLTQLSSYALRAPQTTTR